MRHRAARRQSVAQTGLEMARRAQVEAGFFAGFLGLRALALDLRGVAGRIAIGRPAGAAAASLGSGSGLNCARHGGESWDFLATMQAVTRSTFGNFGAAQPEGVAGAGLLLLGGIGLAGGRPHRNRERGRQHQADMKIPDPKSRHNPPRK